MSAEIALPKIMRIITIAIAVTGVKRTRLRVWLGCKILTISAAVMGCNVEVDFRS